MIKIEKGKKYLKPVESFLGGELIERILQQGGDIVGFKKWGKLIELKSKYKDRNLDIHTGDICDISYQDWWKV